MAILAGDIGGTKTLLQLIDNKQVLFEQRYSSHQYTNLLAMIEAFLASAKIKLSSADISISQACFGIAGPIQGNTAQVTNLPWLIKSAQLESALNINKVILINDFKAVASSLDVLPASELCILQKGKEIEHAPRVVIGAGTGLGSAFLFFNGSRYEVFSSESSHAAFAPVDSMQIELLQFLRKKYRQVTYEHIVSGPGLINIFEFLQVYLKSSPIKSLSEAMQSKDHAAVISQFALEQKDPIAIQALDIFTQVYARQAANLALTSLAYGGVYIAGGIAPKIIEKLKQTDFIDHFKDNDSMGYLLDDMPVKVLMNEHAGLMGAAAIAASSQL